MDTTSLPGMPVNSETFLSPALCTYKKGDPEFVSAQNAKRERITCALGIDVHYELNVPSNEGGLEEERLQPFNPRISSPACPYNYTGKFIDEETFRNLYDDPVLLGEAIERTDPYDPPLYAKKDPRLVTKTQVIRDFGCKVPIDLANTQSLAEAVLNYYPDKYVTFLNMFVSNLFGDGMKHFLSLQIDGYRKMLDNPAELNRISWGSFTSVRGKDDAPGLPGQNQHDCTLRMDSAIKDELNKLALNGTGMTSNVNARDIYDLKPCIEQHIETLRTMHDEWCLGYASKETYTLVMMYYANEQGRRLCWDRRLMSKQDTPDYDMIRLHVPASLYEYGPPDLTAPGEMNPDRLSAIHKNLSIGDGQCEQIETFAYSVGRWSGSEEMANVFLNSATQAPFMWGWGHPFNLMQQIRTSTTGIDAMAVPPVVAIRATRGAMEQRAAAATAMYGFAEEDGAMVDSGFGTGNTVKHILAPYLAYSVGGAHPYGRFENGVMSLAGGTMQEAAWITALMGAGDGELGDTEYLVHLDTTLFKPSRMYVEKWRSLWRGGSVEQGAMVDYRNDYSELIPKGHKERRTSLRTSLLDPGHDLSRGTEGVMHYRGSTDDPTTYRAVQGLPSDATAQPFRFNDPYAPARLGGQTALGARDPPLGMRDSGAVALRTSPPNDDVVCNTDEGIQIFDKTYYSCGHKFDPFLKTGPCFDLDDNGEYVMNPMRMELYKVDDIVTNPVTTKMMVNAMSILLDGAAPKLGSINNQSNIATLVAKYNSRGGAGGLNSHLVGGTVAANVHQANDDTCESLKDTIKDALDFFDNMQGGAVTNRIVMLKTLLNTLGMNELNIPFRVIAKGLFSPQIRTADALTNPQTLIQSLFDASDSTTDYVIADNGFSSGKTLKVNMSDAKTTRANQLGMRLVSFRKSIQYCLGPDAAFVICRDPLGTVRSWEEFALAWKNGMDKKECGWQGTWKLNMHMYIMYLEQRTKFLTATVTEIIASLGYTNAVMPGGGWWYPWDDAQVEYWMTRDNGATPPVREGVFGEFVTRVQTVGAVVSTWMDPGGTFHNVCKKMISSIVLAAMVQSGMYNADTHRLQSTTPVAPGGVSLTSNAIAIAARELSKDIDVEKYSRVTEAAAYATAVARGPPNFAGTGRLRAPGRVGGATGDDPAYNPAVAVPPQATMGYNALGFGQELLRKTAPNVAGANDSWENLGAGGFNGMNTLFSRYNTAAALPAAGGLANRGVRCTPHVADTQDASLLKPLHLLRPVVPLDHTNVITDELVTKRIPSFPYLTAAQVFKYDLVSFEFGGETRSAKKTENLLKFMQWKMNTRFDAITNDSEIVRKKQLAEELAKACTDLPLLAMTGDAAADCTELPRTQYTTVNPAGVALLPYEIGVGDTIKSMINGRKRLCALFSQRRDQDFSSEIAQLMYSLMGLMVDPRMMYYSSLGSYATEYVVKNPTQAADRLMAAAEEAWNVGNAGLPVGGPPNLNPYGADASTFPAIVLNPLPGAGTANVEGSFATLCEGMYEDLWGIKTDNQGVIGRLHPQAYFKSFDPATSDKDKIYRGVGGDGSYETRYGMLAGAPIISAYNAGFVLKPANMLPLAPGVLAGNLTGPVPNVAQIRGLGTTQAEPGAVVDDIDGTEWRVANPYPQIKANEMSFIPLKKITQNNALTMPNRFVGDYNAAAVSPEHALDFLNQARTAVPGALQTTGASKIVCRAQMFAMLDAAAVLWGKRCFFNPADSHRPDFPQEGDSGDMHPWCQILVESFLASREKFGRDNPEEFWEEIVHSEPEQAFSAKKFIGALCDDSFQKLFPLVPQDHKIRDCMRKVRSLGVMWGMLPSYGVGSSEAVVSKQGAWMPLSEAHRVRLLKSVGLFDMKHQVPSNPWLPRNGEGLCYVYNQSYHSVYPVDNVSSSHFREWVTDVCRYQPPSKDPNFCNYPFSQYGGTPVEADFMGHKVEAAEDDDDYITKRHAQLIYNRFGFTKPMRLGQQFQDSGYLQDLYNFSYRTHLKLSKEQKALPKAGAIYPSNFMAYARNHAILALSSCNHGTNKISEVRVVRNLYRMFVDSYDVCANMPSDNDHVPVIMGFLPNYVTSKSDRPMIMFAGSLPCLNAKLEKFCFSSANAGEKICQNYKQTYLNDAALLFTRLVRSDRRRGLHRRNYRRAAAKRGNGFTPIQFFQELVDVQDAYIEFLQTTLISMALESDVDMRNLPLHLLEPREVEVSVHEEDTDVVGNDFLGPRTLDIVKDLKIDGDNISRTQLAILSLMPPNHRVLGTLRLNQQTDIVDLEHVRKQIQKGVMEGNKKVWGDHLQKVIRASLGMRFLEQNGPIDFSLDESAFKDPLAESSKVAKYMTATNAQMQSSVAQNQAAYGLRKNTGPASLVRMNQNEYAQALDAVKVRVQRDYDKAHGAKSHLQCLLELRVPEHVKNELRSHYQRSMMY
jgi:hypothetical protein